MKVRGLIMTNLAYCTLTGLDDSTDLVRVVDLSRQYPLVEWGVLLGGKHGQGGRYPSLSTIYSIIHKMPANVKLALHLCGRMVDDAVIGQGVAAMFANEVHSRGGRVQLNFNLRNRSEPLAYAEYILEDALGPVITQENKGNGRIVIDSPRHNVLFDASGGRGVEIGELPIPIDGVLCGYAGGLGPENVSRYLDEISRTANGRPFWIDMESSLRDENDLLSLDKAEIVLKTVFAATCDA